MSANEAFLAGEGLACRRGERLLFERLSFALTAGGALALTGPNGSGKTSLLRLIAGLLRPAAGRVLWQGRPITEDREGFCAALHYVGHADAVKPMLTVAENVRFWAGLRGAGETGLATALARLGLAALGDMPARFLSAGQRRRVGLARLLAAPAKLWLLDEPTASLDAESAAALERIVAEHRARGGLVVVAGHGGLVLDGAQTIALGRSAAA